MKLDNLITLRSFSRPLNKTIFRSTFQWDRNNLILPFFLPLKSSTILVLALTIVISLNIVLKLREYLLIRDLFVILIFALAGRVFSFFFLNHFGDMDIMKIILGFVLTASVFYLNMKKKDIPSRSHGIYFAMIIGIIGGFIGGIFAVGGPFFVLYFLMKYKEKNIYNANLQITFVLLNTFSTILHGLNGDITNTLSLYLILGTVVVLIGSNLGLRWFHYLPNNAIEKLASVIVLFSAFNLIFLA